MIGIIKKELFFYNHSIKLIKNRWRTKDKRKNNWTESINALDFQKAVKDNKNGHPHENSFGFYELSLFP